METLSADTALPVAIAPSPNHGPRRAGIQPDMLVLHYTGMRSADAALTRLCDPASEVSAHYLIHEDGRIVQMVAEAQRAWHAGLSAWGRQRDINSHSIGLEIVNPGHDHGYRDFPPAQMDAVIALCVDIVQRRGIRAERVLAHSDVAPARKLDPGERFGWDALHAAGIGHWVEPAPLTPAASALKPGDTGREIAGLQRQLQRYGYALAASATYDPTTQEVVAAFQRHFRPARVDGIADVSTRDTLSRLLAALPRSP
jgi:N-acetylmuramoyl-L-alanine amidase